MTSTTFIPTQAAVDAPVEQASSSSSTFISSKPILAYTETDPLAPNSNSRRPSLQTQPTSNPPPTIPYSYTFSRRESFGVCFNPQLPPLPPSPETPTLTVFRRISVIVEQLTECRPGSMSPPPNYDPEKWDPSPVYERLNQNPETIARHLFKFGFFCPLLWVIASLTLIIPTSSLSTMSISGSRGCSDEDLEEGKTSAERDEERAIARAAELKWARRSLAALVTFCVLVLTVIVFVMLLVGSSRHECWTCAERST